jgi:pseudomonalisin
MSCAVRFSAFLSASLLSLPFISVAAAQTPSNRISGPIDDERLVTLTGNVHPLARAEYDQGQVESSMAMERMVLELRPSATQQAALDGLVEAQQDPASPLYHQWLTPTEYGARFGASADDLARIVEWLSRKGFRIEEIAAGARQIVFSGTAGQVADTFHTEIHRYSVAGTMHTANAEDPQIPAALAGVVTGIVSLHDFARVSQMRPRVLAGKHPSYTDGSSHYLFPADWAAIYDLVPLYAAGTSGSGTSIAIVGRSNISLSDVATFRQTSGLPANAPQVTLVDGDPGLVEGDQDESTLDVEWSGATAPAATIKFVVGASTASTDGVDLSALYIVNHASAPVMSTSYGSCEADMGATELAFYSGLWQQAASEGISSLVSSDDSGVAGCYASSDASAGSAGVNGLCSSPYSTCVGGTEFNEGSNASAYWSSTNTAASASALGYIPEMVWNESGANGGSGLWASGGGVSTYFTQPAWQKNLTGTSIASGMRAVPDVAATAASHDGYMIVENGGYYVVAGTSAAAPSFAGVMALVDESNGGKGQGNANPALYALLNTSQPPFHPTPSGNNSVPGVTGFTATGVSYNLATGLGSIDGAALMADWGKGSSNSAADFALTASATSGTALRGKTVSFTLAVTESGAAKNKVTLAAKAPSGVTVTLGATSLSPGSTVKVTVSVGSTASFGSQSVVITGGDTTGTQTITYALTVVQPPTLSLTAAATSVSLIQGSSAQLSLSAVTGGSWSGSLAFSATGLPSGVTCQWSANPVTPSSGASTTAETLTLTASSLAAVEGVNVTIAASGDGLAATASVTVHVQVAPGVQISASPSSLSVLSPGSAATIVTVTPIGGAVIPAGAAGSTVAVTSGLPKGVTASWGTATLSSTGSAAWRLTLTGSSAAAAGSSTLTIAASIAGKSGATYTAVCSVSLKVTLSRAALTSVRH